MDDNIAKKGYLEGFLRSVAQDKKWQKRYYVLYDKTSHCQPRLDYYPDEDSFKKEPAVRKTVYIEEIKNIIQCSKEGRKFCLQLVTDTQRDHLLAAISDAEASAWLKVLSKLRDRANRDSDMRSAEMNPDADDDDTAFDDNLVYESLEEAREYEVVVQQTDSADRCGISELPMIFSIAKQHIRLSAETNPNLMFTWPYRYIRRYGRNKLSFTFEAGRKCSSGPGLFTLKTKEGHQIFQEIRNLTQNMQHGSYTGASKATSNSYSPEPGTGMRSKRNSEGYKPPVPGRPPGLTSYPPASKLAVPTGFVDDLKSKLDGKGGKPRSKSPTSLDFKSEGVLRPKSPNSPETLTAGLGKVRLVNGQSTESYTSVYEAKKLDPDYVSAKTTDDGPDYAVYDYRASSRFSSLTEAASPEVDEYAEVNKIPKQAPKQTGVSLAAALRSKPKVETESDTYSHLNIAAPPSVNMMASQRPLPETPANNNNTYELADFDNDQSHLYDEVGHR